jgi:metal-responsive CopG/Arc/MetJ family transcriptional regulator
MAMKPVMVLMPAPMIQQLDSWANKLTEMDRSKLIRKVLRDALRKRKKGARR